MIPLMGTRKTVDLAIAALATAAALWAYAAQPRAASRAPAVVPIQDGKAIDFSGGSPVIRDDRASKARMDAALQQIDDASANVTIATGPTPTPTQKK